MYFPDEIVEEIQYDEARQAEFEASFDDAYSDVEVDDTDDYSHDPDQFADSEILASAGYGMDEDYGSFDSGDDF